MKAKTKTLQRGKANPPVRGFQEAVVRSGKGWSIPVRAAELHGAVPRYRRAPRACDASKQIGLLRVPRRNR